MEREERSLEALILDDNVRFEGFRHREEIVSGHLNEQDNKVPLPLQYVTGKKGYPLNM